MQYFGSNSGMTRASVISILSCEVIPRYWKWLVWGFCLKPDSLDFRKWEERGGCFDLSNYHHLAGPSLGFSFYQSDSMSDKSNLYLSRASLSPFGHTPLTYKTQEAPRTRPKFPEMRNPMKKTPLFQPSWVSLTRDLRWSGPASNCHQL